MSIGSSSKMATDSGAGLCFEDEGGMTTLVHSFLANATAASSAHKHRPSSTSLSPPDGGPCPNVPVHGSPWSGATPAAAR